jgi:hypothetical protein
MSILPIVARMDAAVGRELDALLSFLIFKKFGVGEAGAARSLS